MTDTNTARLLIACPDRSGIVAAVCGFLAARKLNVTALDEHSTDPSGGTLFMRLEFQADGAGVNRQEFATAFSRDVAEPLAMRWTLRYVADLKRMAILVSKYDHGMLELLWRWRRGELPAIVTQVISNHSDLKSDVEAFGVPFVHIPVTPETKPQAEKQILERIGKNTDVVVLARYMQILSGDFVAQFPNRIINIHHSFLPAFIGADPYAQAYQRGVKLIGATAHYVTEELDGGPIIEQHVGRVTHRASVADLRELGRDIERQVLARAVKWHLEDRIIVDGNKTVVFV